MKYGYTILYVDNVTDTLSFYEKAFDFKTKFVTPENDYGELISGDTTISFASKELGHSNFTKGYEPLSFTAKPVGVELVFVTESLEADFQRALEAGAVEYESVQEKPWGQQVGYVRDNNGFLIELCTPMPSDD